MPEEPCKLVDKASSRETPVIYFLLMRSLVYTKTPGQAAQRGSEKSLGFSFWLSYMAQWVKALGIKSGDLNSIPRAHMVKRED